MNIAWQAIRRAASAGAFIALASTTALPVIAQTTRDAGQRQSRAQAAPGITPLARIDSRIQNRITSRIGGRIDRAGTPDTGQVEQFGDALDRSRAASRTRR
jgi:hypothetical protein